MIESNDEETKASAYEIPIESRFLSQAHQTLKQRKSHIREILLDHKHEIDGIFNDISLYDPSLFQSNNHQRSILQLEAEFEAIHHGLLDQITDSKPIDFKEFEREVANQTIVLDEISLQYVQQCEQTLVNQSNQAIKQANDAYQARWNELMNEHESTLKSIKSQHEAAIKQVVDQTSIIETSHSKWMNQLEQAMNKVRCRMIAAVKEQQRLIDELYGELVVAKSVDWMMVYERFIHPLFSKRLVRPTHLTHSILSVRIDCLRAVKAKLPAGMYTMMATLYSRLGDRGERMTVNETIYRSTEERIPIKHYDYTRVPQRHSGLGQAVELCFDQPINHLYLALENDAVTITSCLLIEVIALKGSMYKADRTIAYQYWPISDLAHQLNTGLIKLPLIRGDPRDGELDRERTIKQSYKQFQSRITNNLDRWLCNCYMTIDLQSIDKHSVMQLRKSRYDHLLNHSVPLSADAKQDKLKELAVHNAALRELNRSSNEKKLGNFGTLIFKKIMNNSTNNQPIKDPSLTSSDHQREWDKQTAMKRRFSQLSAYHTSCHHHASQAHHKLASRTRSSKWALAKMFLHEITLSINRSIHLSIRSCIKFLILFVFMFIVQFLIHYLAHYWALTKVLDVDVLATHIKFGKVSFDFPYERPYRQLSTGDAMVFLLFSFYGNIMCTIILLLLFIFVHRWAHLTMPHFAYESMLIYCCHSIASPLYSIIVNAAYGEMYADEWAVLISSFNRSQWSFLGVVICFGLFALLVAQQGIILLTFVLYEWEAGSLIDVFARLVATEAQLYVPLDFEVSASFVRASLTESAKWQGLKGGTRRVMVTQYLPAENADRSGDSLLHVSIWNVTQRKRLQQTKHEQNEPPPLLPRASVESFERSFTDTRAQASSLSISAFDAGPGRGHQSSMFQLPQLASEQAPLAVEPLTQPRKTVRETRDLHRHFMRDADGTWIELIDGCESYGGDRLAKVEAQWLDEQDQLFDQALPLDIEEEQAEGNDVTAQMSETTEADCAKPAVPRITMSSRQSSQAHLLAATQNESKDAVDDDDDSWSSDDGDHPAEDEVVQVADTEQPLATARPLRHVRLHNRLGSLHNLTIMEEDDEPDD